MAKTQLQYDNIFDAITTDAGEAADLKFRSDLMIMLRDYFKAKQWTQADVMKKLGVPQPRVSELVTGKIQVVSADKLIRYLAKLGFFLEPTFEPKRKNPIRFDVRMSAGA